MATANRNTTSEKTPRYVRPADFMRDTGLGRSKTYDLIWSGELPSIRVGRAVLIPTSAIDKFLADKESEIQTRIAI